MKTKHLSVKPFEEVLKELNENLNGNHNISSNANQEFYKILLSISDKFKKEKKNYVYTVEYEYGDKIVSKGSNLIDNYSLITSDLFPLSQEDVKKDLSYSHDPLGLVISNSIQVYTENRYLTTKKEKKANIEPRIYLVPLNQIEKGGFFGSFGTLDYLTYNKKYFNYNQDWNVIAGSICYKLAFIFHNTTNSKLFAEDLRVIFRTSSKELSYIGEEKIYFVKKYLKKWNTKIVYFPKHYFDIEDCELKVIFENLLFKIGWNQSNEIRYNLFENKFISDIIFGNKKDDLHHDLGFLSFLFNYVLKAERGQAYVLKPISKTHYLNDVIKGFKKEHEDYFNKTNYTEPIIFEYDYINNQNDWGLLSLYNLPILNNYIIKSNSELIEDLVNINKTIIEENNRIKNILLYANDGGANNKYIKKMQFLKDDYLSSSLELSNKVTINMNSDDLRSMLHIKSIK